MFTQDQQFYIAHDQAPLCMVPQMANRHGLIAGATGTGKTVSLQVLAETFSQAGVPCFMADMKGDLSGISQTGSLTGFIEKRCAEFGIAQPAFAPCPTRFFDVFGEQGHPLRTTVSNMGPLLLGRLLQLNDTQTGVLMLVFKIADDQGLLLIDLKDLRSMLNYVAAHAKEYTLQYGQISPQTVGAILRALLALENEGASCFFGEPAFNIQDLLQTEGGKGVMNVLAADRLMQSPKLYSSCLLWLLSELYTQLPEVGDLPLPKFILFLDEAHMLFSDTPKVLVEKIEQIIRLIRSKGVGVYFITQSPTDIPQEILGQLGNRIQHALRAYTPKDQKAVRTAAQTFRPNPAFDTQEAIMELSTGEALVSFLDEKGAPCRVSRAKMLFPLSSIGAITPAQREDLIRRSRLYGIYERSFDRESAYEILTDRKQREDRLAQAQKEEAQLEAQRKQQWARTQRTYSTGPTRSTTTRRTSTRMTPLEKALGSAASTMGREVSGKLIRSILGTLFK